MSAWQPIETAPKDGTRVLGYDSKAGRCILRRGYLQGALVTETWAIDETGQMESDPHLWQPLPPPPEKKP